MDPQLLMLRSRYDSTTAQEKKSHNKNQGRARRIVGCGVSRENANMGETVIIDMRGERGSRVIG